MDLDDEELDEDEHENGSCNEMIVSRNIKCESMCEHHLVAFFGQAHVAYFPRNRQVLGLSKLNRCVHYFSRRPQIQERLTEQIHAALSLILNTDDIAVVLKCQHLCVQLRGVKDNQSSVVTSKLTGAFRKDTKTRAEFMNICLS